MLEPPTPAPVPVAMSSPTRLPPGPLKPFGCAGGAYCRLGAESGRESRPAEGKGLPSPESCFFWNRERGPVLPAGPNCRPSPAAGSPHPAGFCEA